MPTVIPEDILEAQLDGADNWDKAYDLVDALREGGYVISPMANIRLSDYHLKDCQTELARRNFYGTFEQVREIVMTDSWLVQDLLKNAEPAPGNTYYGLDTLPREHLIDAFARKLLGEEFHWPVHMDSEEYTEKFITDLTKAAIDAGWAIRDS